MYLKKVDIQNFRGIEHIELHLKPGVNLLIGENSAGKTSILEAIAVGLGGLFNGMPSIKVAGFQQSDIRKKLTSETSATTSIVYEKASVEIEVDIGGNTLSCMRYREDPSQNGKTNTTGSEAKRYLQKAANESDSSLPVLNYMGISRVISSKRADFGKAQQNNLMDRRCGYIGCLDGVPSKKTILDWIQKMSYESFFQQRELNEKKLFDNVVSGIMQKMNELDKKPSVRYSPVFDGLSYKEGDEEQPISNMSAGYQSILWIAMDIAFRVAQLNPNMDDPSEAVGIVLIDEIDMHLHPKWQWNILSALSGTFPKIQFILATHAPIVISSLKEGALILVSNCNEAEEKTLAYAYSLKDVVELRQGSSGIPNGLRILERDFDKAYREDDIPMAEAIYAQMCEEYGENTPSARKAKQKLDF